MNATFDLFDRIVPLLGSYIHTQDTSIAWYVHEAFIHELGHFVQFTRGQKLSFLLRSYHTVPILGVDAVSVGVSAQMSTTCIDRGIRTQRFPLEQELHTLACSVRVLDQVGILADLDGPARYLDWACARQFSERTWDKHARRAERLARQPRAHVEAACCLALSRQLYNRLRRMLDQQLPWITLYARTA